jgi:AcrR family transcriptional regulator
MSKGAIYHYYSSKKDVYLAVIEMWEEHTQKLLAPAATENSSADGIRTVFNLFKKQLKIDGSFFNCLPTLWAIARHDDDFKIAMQKVYNRFQKFIELIILKGIESKEFGNLRPENSKTSALSLILNFEGIFWFNIFQSKYVDAEKYIDEISNYILYAYTQEGDK